jgi:hypothetical protein
MLRLRRRVRAAARTTRSSLARDVRRYVPVSASRDKQLISPGEYGAWLFDLDGVITDTASVHAAAWKRTFDGYLKEV